MEWTNQPLEGQGLGPPSKQAIWTQESTLPWLLDRLRRSEKRVARIIAETSRKEVKEYQAFVSPEQFQAVVEDTRRHLRRFAQCAPSGRMPNATELDFVTELARLRAAAGFPLEAMLHAFRVGHRVLWDWLVGQVDDERKGEVALTITPFMHEYLGMVTRRLSELYIEAVQTSMADADKNRRDLLEAVLRGEESSRTRHLVHVLGLEPNAQYVVIVATVALSDPNRANELLRRAQETIQRRLQEAGVEAIAILRHDEVVLLVPWASDGHQILRGSIEPAAAAVAQMYGARLIAGGSAACDGLTEIRLGYQQARLALQRASATGAFVALADASLFESLLALGAPAIERRLPSWAANFAADDSPDRQSLIPTLLAYVATDMSVQRAARELFVHPNTVRYRLRQLSRLTGLDVGSFYDLVELVTAIRLLPTSPGTSPRSVQGNEYGPRKSRSSRPKR